MYSSVPARVGRDLTSISICIFGSGICFCSVELANSTIVVKGVFLCKVSPGVLKKQRLNPKI